MKANRIRRKALLLTVILGAFVAFFYFVYRPWQLSWGATPDEVAGSMVGDELVKNPTFDATRAVTINAPAERIWPWIVQIGYKKAGFYSWDILDNDGIPSAQRIIPEFQKLKIGDVVPLSEHSDAAVVSMEPNEHLLLVFQSDGNVTWAWALYEIDANQTRLVNRLRWHASSAVSQFVLDAFEIVMMRKHLMGIKRRAETSIEEETADATVSALQWLLMTPAAHPMIHSMAGDDPLVLPRFAPIAAVETN
jgi:hypothetical protein